MPKVHYSTYGKTWTTPTNEEILNSRLNKFNMRSGPRVGDYLYIPGRGYTRFTHNRGDKIQTGGYGGGSFYLCESGGMSYSGGLDPGVATSDLILTNEKRTGSLWFFDKNRPGAGRGVTYKANMKVYTIKESADLSGIFQKRLEK